MYMDISLFSVLWFALTIMRKSGIKRGRPGTVSTIHYVNDVR